MAARPTHVAAIDPAALTVVNRVHHVHSYLDGELEATLTLRDAADGTVLFTRRVRATASRRARKSSAAEVRTLLVADAIDQWINALRANDVEAHLQPRRTP